MNVPRASSNLCGLDYRPGQQLPPVREDEGMSIEWIKNAFKTLTERKHQLTLRVRGYGTPPLLAAFIKSVALRYLGKPQSEADPKYVSLIGSYLDTNISQPLLDSTPSALGMRNFSELGLGDRSASS